MRDDTRLSLSALLASGCDVGARRRGDRDINLLAAMKELSASEPRFGTSPPAIDDLVAAVDVETSNRALRRTSPDGPIREDAYRCRQSGRTPRRCRQVTLTVSAKLGTRWSAVRDRGTASISLSLWGRASRALAKKRAFDIEAIRRSRGTPPIAGGACWIAGR
jgi:hypothetical protein